MKIVVGFIQWVSSMFFILLLLRTFCAIQNVDTSVTFIKYMNIIIATLLSFCISYKMWFEPFMNEFYKELNNDNED